MDGFHRSSYEQGPSPVASPVSVDLVASPTGGDLKNVFTAAWANRILRSTGMACGEASACSGTNTFTLPLVGHSGSQRPKVRDMSILARTFARFSNPKGPLESLSLHRAERVNWAPLHAPVSRETHREVLKRARRSNVIVHATGVFGKDDPDSRPDVLRRVAGATGCPAFLSAPRCPPEHPRRSQRRHARQAYRVRPLRLLCGSARPHFWSEAVK